MPESTMPPGQNKWWVRHVKCAVNWSAGPFETETDANNFRDTLISPDSCPGCGKATPEAADYNISQM